MKFPNFTLIELVTCLVLGILIVYFFAIPTTISLSTTVSHILAIAIIFLITRRKRLKMLWFGAFSLLSIVSIDALTNNTQKEIQKPDTAKIIVKNATAYLGTKYKYGGTTKHGMDCSGLILTSFKKENILLPRASYKMAKTGNWVALEKVKVGDLLFFSTQKNNRKINHVGLVTTKDGDAIEFIHSTTKRGVIVSKLEEKYWFIAFVQARRVL